MSRQAVCACMMAINVVLSQPITSVGGPIDPPIVQTIRQRIATSQIVVLARLVSDQKGPRPSNVVMYEITVVLKQQGKARLRIGERVALPVTAANPAPMLLAMGDLQNEGNLQWEDQWAMTQESSRYVTKIAGQGMKESQILAYCLSLIDSKDELVQVDVHAELENASLQDLIGLKSKMDRDGLQARFLSKSTAAERVALYGLLLGICGNDQVKEVLRDTVLENSGTRRRSRNGIESIMLGYLLLSKNEGLVVLSRHKLRDAQTPFGEIYAALRAITRMWLEVPETCDRQMICETLRPLLDREDLADVVIPRLAMLRDWTVQDKLANMYKSASNAPCGVVLRRSILQFMEASKQDVPQGSPDVPRHAIEAGEFLKSVAPR